MLQQRLQFAGFIHLVHDVRAADEFARHVELRDGGPTGEFLDALTDFVVFQHVDGNQLLHATALQDLNGLAGKAALRELGGALHEQHDGVLGHGFADEFLNVAHGGLLDRHNGIGQL
ncbi:hypothetical protein D3C84_1089110 [compost metagenome]